MRTRDLGIAIGLGSPGPLNAITDVAGRPRGTRHASSKATGRSSSARDRSGPASRSSCRADPRREPVFAGCHRLNGNGELTGLEWVRESGKLTGSGRDHQHAQRRRRPRCAGRRLGRARGPASRPWSLPVVGETYDGLLNDINGFHVRAEHLRSALDTRQRRPGRGRRRRWRDRDGLPRVQGWHRDRVAGPPGGTWRAHGRRPGPGQLREARLAARRRRAGRCRDRGR